MKDMQSDKSLDVTPTQRAEVLIRPRGGLIGVNWNELYRYRELLWYLTTRDIKARYKQTLLGPIWIILMPLVTSGIFGLILGTMAGLPSGEVPYPIFVYSGMVLWTLTSTAVTSGATCLQSNQNLLTKVYFPRLMLPMAASLKGIVDFALGVVVMLVILWMAGFTPGWPILLAPIYALLAVLTGLTFGVWLAAMGVRFRDINHGGQFISRIWMWLTPVAFSSSLVIDSESIPEDFREITGILFQLNPMFHVIEGWRWAMLGTPVPGDLWTMPLSLLFLLMMLLGGIIVFQRAESTFADVV